MQNTQFMETSSGTVGQHFKVIFCLDNYIKANSYNTTYCNIHYLLYIFPYTFEPW